MKRLIKLQQALKVQKDKQGYGFQYRDAEAILEAAKPILAEINCAIITTTNLIEIGGYVYFNCTTSLYGEDGSKIAEASAQVADPHKMVKGKNEMETQQVSGSNITYAKRYALQNLLAIDNGADDPDAISRETKEANAKDDSQHKKAKAAMDFLSSSSAAADYYCKGYKVDSIDKLSVPQQLGVYEDLVKNKKIQPIK